jgi:hypothetical protein
MIRFRAGFKSPIIPIAFFAFCAALVLIGMPEPLLHPCHPGGPGGPGAGPPCPPTPTPAAAAPLDDTGLPAGTGPVRFLVRNETSDNVTLWLGDPIDYVINVSGTSEAVFTVDRGVYPYDLAACGRVSQGYLNLTIHSFIDIESCEDRTLVAVDLHNLTGDLLALQLHGPADYVLQLRPGQTLPVTIQKGDYEAVLIGCLGPAEITFSASAGRTVEIECP